MGVAAIFLDGGHLSKVLKYNFGGTRIDYAKLVRELLGGDELLRTYYYDCQPYQSSPPTEEEDQRSRNWNRFRYRLEHLPRFELRLGRLKKIYTETGTVTFEQKRVDCMIGVDTTRLSATGKVSRIVLFSGDSDFVPAVEAVKSDGVIVTLWHGDPSYSKTSPSRELIQVADEHFVLSKEVVNRCALES